jgi:hypothetical protein
MGVDIHGWVETRRPKSEEWEAAIRIDDIVYRQYGMFASLFGVQNWGQERTLENGRFWAIASGRGAPERASSYYREERDRNGGAVGETWVLWSELAVINWDEEGGEYIDTDGTVWSTPGPGRRRERRRDYRNGGWTTLLRMMNLLARQFDEENVRLAVWFDQW